MYINITHPVPVQKSERPVTRAREKAGDKTFADIVETAIAVDSVDINGERRQQEHKEKREEKKDEPKKAADGLNITV